MLLTLVLRAEEGVSPARTDLYGDPLPEGAVMRLGVLPERRSSKRPTSLQEWLGVEGAATDRSHPLLLDVEDMAAEITWMRESRKMKDRGPSAPKPRVVPLDSTQAEVENLLRIRPTNRRHWTEQMRAGLDAAVAESRQRRSLVDRDPFFEEAEVLGVFASAVHGTAVTQVDFSDTLTSRDEDGVRIRWDLTTGFPMDSPATASPGQGNPPNPTARGESPPELADCAGGSTCVASSPDGRLWAWGRLDGSIVVKEALSTAILYNLRGHDGAVRCLTFSPNGARLASGGDDGTVLVWDLLGTGPQNLAECWPLLASTDAREAFEAANRLCLAGDDAVAFLSAHPDAGIDRSPGTVALLAALDADDWQTREEATRRLIEIGGVAVPALLERLGQTATSPEACTRIGIVLATLAESDPCVNDYWPIRAVHVLERIASPSGVEALREMASRIDSPRVQCIVQEALGRLGDQARPRCKLPH